MVRPQACLNAISTFVTETARALTADDSCGLFSHIMFNAFHGLLPGVCLCTARFTRNIIYFLVICY